MFWMVNSKINNKFGKALCNLKTNEFCNIRLSWVLLISRWLTKNINYFGRCYYSIFIQNLENLSCLWLLLSTKEIVKEFNLESRATGVNNSSNLDITRHANYCQIDVFQDFPPASPVEFDTFYWNFLKGTGSSHVL